MTRVAVFSDTHGDISRFGAAMAAIEAVDALLHLGDYGSDAERMAAAFKLPFFAVRGNCDMGGAYPAERVVTFEKAALFLTHGHRYPDIYSLSLKAEDMHCGAVLFGHTHEPLLNAAGSLLIVNPGSLSRPRFQTRPSFCVLTIDGADIRVRMLSLPA